MIQSEMEPSVHKDSKRPLDSPSFSSKPLKTSRAEDREGEVAAEIEEKVRGESLTIRSGNRSQRYLVSIEYIGTRFLGSQRQPNFRTVIGCLEKAFQKFVGQPVSIFCSSRTDTGVHALSNVCHVDVERISKRKPGEILQPHEPDVVKKAVNHFLQKNEGDMMVVDVRCVPPDFHARYKALERTYFYRFLSGPEPLSVFERDRAWHIPEELDILSIQEACKILVGCHDFSSFRGSGCQAKSPIKTLDELHISEVTPSLYFPSTTEWGIPNSSGEPLAFNVNTGPTPQGSFCSQNCASTDASFGQRKSHRCYIITARAPSFLYHQVRLIVGVLKCVGMGNLTVNDVKKILDAKTVTASSAMAPSCGLYLGNVKYDLP